MSAGALPLPLVPLDTRERACLDEAAWALVLGGGRTHLTLHHCRLQHWGLALIHLCRPHSACSVGHAVVHFLRSPGSARACSVFEERRSASLSCRATSARPYQWYGRRPRACVRECVRACEHSLASGVHQRGLSLAPIASLFSVRNWLKKLRPGRTTGGTRGERPAGRGFQQDDVPLLHVGNSSFPLSSRFLAGLARRRVPDPRVCPCPARTFMCAENSPCVTVWLRPERRRTF